MTQPKRDYSKKPGLHSRNPHKSRYNFPELVKSFPELGNFTAPNKYGDVSIDFANPEAVKALNRALLTKHYGVEWWDIPQGYLCPPIPGRADYIHYLADLLADSNGGEIPKGKDIHGLDVGTGSNAIYSILGHRTFGWRFIGSDTDEAALKSANKIFASNAVLKGAWQGRQQMHPDKIFSGIVRPGERFDFTLCNPPFHSSPEEAMAGSYRKWKNLKGQSKKKPLRNFGGQNSELWCPGGEKAFIKKMIWESSRISSQVFWFTTLVSKKTNLPAFYEVLKQAGAPDVRTVEMSQGQKTSRILAWTFLTEEQQENWRDYWQGNEKEEKNENPWKLNRDANPPS